jgi:hypothetical protein
MAARSRQLALRLSLLGLLLAAALANTDSADKGGFDQPVDHLKLNDQSKVDDKGPTTPDMQSQKPDFFKFDTPKLPEFPKMPDWKPPADGKEQDQKDSQQPDWTPADGKSFDKQFQKQDDGKEPNADWQPQKQEKQAPPADIKELLLKLQKPDFFKLPEFPKLPDFKSADGMQQEKQDDQGSKDKQDKQDKSSMGIKDLLAQLQKPEGAKSEPFKLPDIKLPADVKVIDASQLDGKLQKDGKQEQKIMDGLAKLEDFGSNNMFKPDQFMKLQEPVYDRNFKV